MTHKQKLNFFKNIIIIIIAAASIGSGVSAPGIKDSSKSSTKSPGKTMTGKGPVWSEMFISEAFVSRETFIDHGEGSDSEFGRHIMHDGVYQTKGGLYSTMYFPQAPDENVRVVLVELDFWSDDIVAGVNIGRTGARIPVTMNGDYISFKRTAFYPEADSGPDYKKETAPLLEEDISGSVSFIDHDYTDIYRVTGKPSCVMFVSDRSMDYLSIDPPTMSTPSNAPSTFRNFAVFSTDQESWLTIRGIVGGGPVPYQVYLTQGKDRVAAMIEKAVEHLKFQQHAEAARSFYYIDKDAAQKFCDKASIGKNRENHAKFCQALESARSWDARWKGIKNPGKGNK